MILCRVVCCFAAANVSYHAAQTVAMQGYVICQANAYIIVVTVATEMDDLMKVNTVGELQH